MRIPLAVLLVATVASVARAQDKVTLSNGDVLTGAIKTMADGKLTISSPLVGDITVPLSNVANLSTAAPVDLLNTDGERLKRRIAGIEGGDLKLEGDIPSLALSRLGQINPPAKEPEKWTGSLTVGGSLTSGNTERRAIGAAFEAIRRSEIDRITADATWDYSEDKATGDWVLNQRRAGGGLKYDYFISKKWYFLATARVLGDTLADINLRFTGGVGLGYQWVENDTTNFSTEAGLSYFNENYRSATPSVDYLAARVAYKLSHKLGDSTKLLHGTEAFPSLEDANDIYFQMKTEVQTSLTASMIASLGWVWDYDNTPAPGRERSDHRVLLSVGWTF